MPFYFDDSPEPDDYWNSYEVQRDEGLIPPINNYEEAALTQPILPLPF